MSLSDPNESEHNELNTNNGRRTIATAVRRDLWNLS